MPKYAVYGIATGSKFLGEFEADTPDQAQEMAERSDANSICLCHQCANEIEMDDFSFGQFQVEPAE